MREVSHLRKSEDSSSMSQVAPLCLAGMRPCCAAFSKVERSIDRSTESSLMVFIQTIVFLVVVQVFSQFNFVVEVPILQVFARDLAVMERAASRKNFTVFKLNCVHFARSLVLPVLIRHVRILLKTFLLRTLLGTLLLYSAFAELSSVFSTNFRMVGKFIY